MSEEVGVPGTEFPEQAESDGVKIMSHHLRFPATHPSPIGLRDSTDLEDERELSTLILIIILPHPPPQ